ncbi:hypothetical protein KAR02_09455, partial [Candidatus Bipolaricaulota bacterium]|nr:hypothetical protein [Candidatus Bipolaricaulota bacterium]
TAMMENVLMLRLLESGIFVRKSSSYKHHLPEWTPLIELSRIKDLDAIFREPLLRKQTGASDGRPGSAEP